ncbi:cytidine deaminase [Planctomicrobium piriforme]|uniref:Cytidine deaminase n=1 Tax=Planctomicrobium piriforme TaxID=1576369 RepID=A0A1I3DJ48_9PLAN|nr:cytidine deaminase [Planctomicrobium piriforme]SFH86716.1 cytidine deaminase [Planctomicrobium piriforme]
MPAFDASHNELISAARRASELAYAPYSRFPVGAALRTASGKIFSGCNVENASYGLSMCAERNAIFQMVAAGETRFEAIVISTPTQTVTAPCGACRQVLFEFGPQAQVLCICAGEACLETTISELLPHAFGPGNLTP